MNAQCVAEWELRAFLTGDLSEARVEAITRHLEVCRSCEAAARRLDGLADSFVCSLRQVMAPTVATAAPGGADTASPVLPAPAGAGFPRRVAGYELLAELGRGGMSVVYRARQLSPARLVALKMVLGTHATAERRARFLAEADAIARLQHPNIVQVYEVGEHEGQPFFSLELVDGGSLAQKLAGTPQPAGEAAALVETLARAIHYAHQRGIVHRDLKPGNVLLSFCREAPASADSSFRETMNRAVPKITDFGLAKHLDAGRGQTHTGTILGTPSYMAPEQAAGLPGEIGPAADVYALGTILYEMLTGRTPFRGATSLETLEQARTAEPVPPSRLQPQLPRDLETVCLKCLSKEPARRYPSAAELADDLRRFLNGEPVEARRTSAAGRTWRWCRRNPAVSALLTSVAALLLLSAAGASFAALRLGLARDAAVQAERDATERLYRSTFAQAQALGTSGQVGQRFRSLETLEEAAGIARSLGTLDEHLVALRTEAIACLALTDLHVAQEWDAGARAGTFPAPAAAFDAAFERYAWVDEEGVIRVARVADRHELARLPAAPGPLRCVFLQFAAGGRFLAADHWFYGRPSQFALWELSESGPACRLGPLDDVAFHAFSADGRRLALGLPDGSIALHELGGGRRSVLPDCWGCVMAFRPDGRQLAFASREEAAEVQVLDLETGRVVRRLHHPDDVEALAWSADGRLLAAGCDDRNVHVWDTELGKPQAVLEGHQKWVTGLAFSPAGDLLASCALDGTTRLWDPVSGRQLVSAPGACLRFSPDGRRLAFQNGPCLGWWEVADGRECRVLHHGRIGNRAPWRYYKGPECLDFHAGGRLFASAAADGVRLWDVVEGREVAYLNAGHHEAVVFHPDGARLYTFGRTGLWCWPMRPDDRGPGSLRVGPPQRLGTPAVDGWFRGGRSGDGRLVLAGDHLDAHRDRLFVFPADRPAERAVLGEGFKFSRLALSPDGRWAAATLIDSELGIKVWDTQGDVAPRLLPGAYRGLAFSPDGRWLVGSNGSGHQAWAVGSWEPDPVIRRGRPDHGGGSVAFRPDGRLLAVSASLQQIRLVDFATRREIATLAAPDQACVDNWFSFSPDGRLLAVATEAHSVHLWDLGALGRRLWAMGLGHDLLPDLPDPAGGEPPPRARAFLDFQEAENLKLVEAADCWPRPRDARPWGRERWGNGKDLFCFAQKGGFVDLLVDAPETGLFTLEVRFTRQPDFGRVEVTLDGKKLGPAFDGYSPEITPSVPFRLGPVELKEGSHRLRFTVVDRNPSATDWRMGIDSVRLTPAGTPPEATR
jgi:serine/threonine protein kinase/WD40 repeat protein